MRLKTTISLLLLSTTLSAQQPVQLFPGANANNRSVPVYTVTTPTVQSVNTVPTAPETLEANLTSRLSQLEETIRQLNGRVEEQNFQIQQLTQQVNTLNTASQNKAKAPVSEIERTLNQDTPQTNTSEIKTKGPQADYALAYSLVKEGKYDEAATAYQQFLTKYPKHSLADNARYWLAETYYVRQDYGLAAENFLEVYESNPKGNKAADSLLKLALSLSGLKSTEEACVTLDKLSAEYPGASRSIVDRANQEKGKLSCAV